MGVLKMVLILLAVCFLTVLTQVGGLIFLVSLIPHKLIDKKIGKRLARVTAKFFSFLILYLLTIFIIVPIVARPLGRVPLPLMETNYLRPLTFWTCLFNRNYVKPELRDAAFKVASKMNDKYPGTVVNYLDASFPFIDGFPLPPHLSHNDGKKLDVAFSYIDNRTGKQTNKCPSLIGYGICEGPKPNEVNRPEYCAKKGYWQYNILQEIIPQARKSLFAFDSPRTKDLVNYFARQKEVGKIFIEPHLKERLGLTSNKIRLHGCQAVRHDDHLHIQLK